MRSDAHPSSGLRLNMGEKYSLSLEHRIGYTSVHFFALIFSPNPALARDRKEECLTRCREVNLVSRTIVFASVALALLVQWTPSMAQTNDNPTLDQAIHDLNVQQLRIIDLLAEAKKITDPDKIKQAQNLYSDARVQYNAFIEDIARHIQFQTKIDPLKHATDAYSTCQSFTDFVHNNSPTKTGFASAILPVAGELVKQFLGISNGAGKSSENPYTERKDLAERIRQYEWPVWGS